MPRQRIPHSREDYPLPEDFPERLKRFQQSRGCRGRRSPASWEPFAHTVWLWKEGRARPNYQHRKALLELADRLGLAHLFTD